MAARNVLLFDVMVCRARTQVNVTILLAELLTKWPQLLQDTVVKDPFFTHCPQALGLTLKEVSAWLCQSVKIDINTSH